MADIEVALMNLLKNDATMAGLVADRVYVSDSMPSDNNFPAICFWDMNSTPVYNHSGLAGLTAGMYQFHFYAVQQADVLDIKAALYRILGAVQVTEPETDISLTSIPQGSRSLTYTQTTLLYGYEVEFKIWFEDGLAP